MSAVNDSKFQPAVLFLTGIPGLEDVHVWISIPCSLMYVTSILGNSLILFIIKTDPNLHEPMYIFLSMLALQTLVYQYPAYQRRWACSGLTLMLLSMALDRFVAIFIPLRYDSILTPPRISKMGLVSLFRGVALIFPLPILLKQYQYCQANILSHSYCLNQEVLMMACSDFRVNIIYGFFLIVSSVGLDLLLILLSYVMILKTVLSITSHAAYFKSLNTCVSHVCFILLFYMPGIGLSVLYRFVKSSSPLVQNVMSNVSLMVPPLMNPIMYSVKTKHIRARIIRVFVK